MTPAIQQLRALRQCPVETGADQLRTPGHAAQDCEHPLMISEHFILTPRGNLVPAGLPTGWITDCENRIAELESERGHPREHAEAIAHREIMLLIENERSRQEPERR